MELVLRILLKVASLVEWILDLVCSAFGNQEKKIVPANSDPLINFSATALAGKIRRREITSEDVIKAYVKRIKDVNPIINAVVEDRFAAALENAREVDTYLKTNLLGQKELEEKKPLLGVPITVKECLAVKGLSYTGCSKTREGIKAEEDSDVVALMKEAGAIPLLVSNTPEFCTSYDTFNKITGFTANPYNTLRISGGSSGGEAALLASGASVLGLGSDILGSIRVPCAFNGVFGHKPTSGLVPLKGHFPFCTEEKFVEYLVIGPMTRYAEDLKLCLKVIAGKNADKLNLDEDVDFRKLKVFFMEEAGSDFGLLEVEKEIKIAIKEAVMHLSRHTHCIITDRKFAEMGDSSEMIGSTVMRMRNVPDAFTSSEVQYSLGTELVKTVFGKSIFPIHTIWFELLDKLNWYASRNVEKYTEETEHLKKTLIEELKDNSILLYPCYPTAALKPGTHITSMSGSRYPGIVNALGFPAACVPVGFNKDGLPIGIQVIAAPYQDRLCLAVALELEKCFGGWLPPY